jgi:radical SAM protein with 4Fe4S-binding SPASM domain
MGKKPQYRPDGVMHATINRHRLHLRLTDPTEDNFLWIDGQSPPLVLDQTAAEFVGHIIDAAWKFQHGEGDDRSREVIRYVVDRMYGQHGRLLALGKGRVTRRRIRKDLDRVFGTIMAIANGACPAEVTMGPREIEYAKWGAPARMDLAVTYKCNLDCPKCYLGDSGAGPELGSLEWLRILDLLWKIGISQVVFTGGEPTLRPDIVDLISAADRFVTGLVTNGTLLGCGNLAKRLSDASLDYVQVTIESALPEIHDGMTCISGSHAMTVEGIRAALKEGIQVVTNTTLTRANASGFGGTIAFLHELGVRHVACNTLICSGRGRDHRNQNGLSDEDLRIVLDDAVRVAKMLGIGLQWYSPTCYNMGINPIKLGFGIKSCSAAAHNMTIQPDGTVLPCQSWPEVVGNILTDPWDSIWNHATCKDLRERRTRPEACTECVFETTCAGGCPLDTTPRIPRKEGNDNA